MKSLITVENIWVEDLFMWFTEHIAESCGDGTAAIVCKNYEEVSKWFLDWWFTKYNKNLLDYRQVARTEKSIIFHDSNESYIFTNDDKINLFYHDYIFIVTKDCLFGHNRDSERKVLAI